VKLAERGYRVVGIDLDQRALDEAHASVRAKELETRVSIRHGDMRMIAASRILGLPYSDHMRFEDLLQHLKAYICVMPHAVREGFIVAACECSGFSELLKLDRRILLLCILLLQNAAQHSHRGQADAPPGAVVSLKHYGDGYSRINVTSWYSNDPVKVVKASFEEAHPSRPRRTFDALLAIARDLNLNFRRFQAAQAARFR
jgi:hypothetical protein